MLEMIHPRRDNAKVTKSQVNWSSIVNISNLIDNNSGCREEGICIGQERDYAVYKLDISQRIVKIITFISLTAVFVGALIRYDVEVDSGIHDTLNQKVVFAISDCLICLR